MSERGLNNDQVGDIARILDVSKEDVVDMDQRMSGHDVYLNSTVSSEGEDEKIDFLVEPSENQETVLANRQEMTAKQGMLQKALTTLSDRERDIIERRRLKDDPDTLEDLSRAYSISRERVRQIEVRAFEKLQKEMTGAAA
jgi:RNA polymerase sigma-32 factor